MAILDIVIEATSWDASTSIIPLPNGAALLGYCPTTQYLEGSDGVLEVNVLRYETKGVQINRKAVKYNILKLHYVAVGELRRT